MPGALPEAEGHAHRGCCGCQPDGRRGDDFELYCGQDFSIGYRSSDAEQVELYIEELLTFHVHTPEAAVVLDYGG